MNSVRINFRYVNGCNSKNAGIYTRGHDKEEYNAAVELLPYGTRDLV